MVGDTAYREGRTVRNHVDEEIEAHIDAAADGTSAGDSQNAYNSMAELPSEYVEALSRLGRYVDTVESGLADVNYSAQKLSKHEYDAADTSIEDARNEFAEAENNLGDATNSLAKVDGREVEESVEAYDFDDVEDLFDELSKVIDTLSLLSAAMGLSIDGFRDLSDAVESMDAERWSQAGSQSSGAERSLQESTSVLQDSLTVAPDQILGGLREWKCYVEAVSEAASGYEETIKPQSGVELQAFEDELRHVNDELERRIDEC